MTTVINGFVNQTQHDQECESVCESTVPSLSHNLSINPTTHLNYYLWHRCMMNTRGWSYSIERVTLPTIIILLIIRITTIIRLLMIRNTWWYPHTKQWSGKGWHWMNQKAGNATKNTNEGLPPKANVIFSSSSPSFRVLTAHRVQVRQGVIQTLSMVLSLLPSWPLLFWIHKRMSQLKAKINSTQVLKNKWNPRFSSSNVGTTEKVFWYHILVFFHSNGCYSTTKLEKSTQLCKYIKNFYLTLFIQ